MLVEDLRRKNALFHNFSWIDEIRFKLVVKYVKKMCYKAASKGYTKCFFYIPDDFVPNKHTSLFADKLLVWCKKQGLCGKVRTITILPGTIQCDLYWGDDN